MLTSLPSGFFSTNSVINRMSALLLNQIAFDCLDALFDTMPAPSVHLSANVSSIQFLHPHLKNIRPDACGRGRSFIIYYNHPATECHQLSDFCFQVFFVVCCQTGNFTLRGNLFSNRGAQSTKTLLLTPALEAETMLSIDAIAILDECWANVTQVGFFCSLRCVDCSIN